jgi:hypothetical protein
MISIRTQFVAQQVVQVIARFAAQFTAGAAVLCLALAGSTAYGQSNVRVRGTIAGLDGNVLSVKGRDGQVRQIALADNATVAATKKITLADIKPGDYVGVTSMKRADGTMVALEVHVLPPVVPAGFIPWDLEPGSMMTNANVTAKVAGTGGHELTLDYKTGTQKIIVPDNVPVAATEPGDRTLLKPGEWVFVVAQSSPDGKLSAGRVQVSKDGVKPPQ